MSDTSRSSLIFRLDVDEVGWPPVAAECLPVEKTDAGYFRIEAPPLFLKGISVGDCIAVELDEENYVANWRTVGKSSRSVLWVLKGSAQSVQPSLDRLIALGCNLVRFEPYQLVSIDVPMTVATADIDLIVSEARAAGAHVAFPSFRHPD